MKNSITYKRGFNAGLEATAKIVQPKPHVEEERECKDVAKSIRKLKISIDI